ncbi:cysteine--1-D-myo-inosityl 2-amino-2-deoxy-alpha-D-glucopyranoside ligase [Corynebacterium heidelbergense]|uniref:L-cysteine:1D-myo-inositol 2-amino-2-deoxy-alpha-D-glucopyranoside ligase n=1 Tax=Corynebacterium heidelbergense TaxID=2055947 RepID=A0A364V620_9CORY|nr:cysteine--1-D-myo-inosityl 2-amino-2-deoxy-alpha-D-glucopyranoside ligase [Corynebacterium heidelbergense]RAV32087.1 cysteine--1-D-myo-inosityl 2-amino-2-deoxy-alpha-D-glucopyranoside ligase [Corynebacterium heidelbergense]
MQSWPHPAISPVPVDLPALRLYDTADDAIKPVVGSSPAPSEQAEVGMYVCGITPYDSTHLGHAATYLTFDTINRYLRACGHGVHYVQNVTDVDDPLFERAERDGVDWRHLGDAQTDLFRSDMTNLSVIPPRDFIGAIESVGEAIAMVQQLLDRGAAYQVDDEYPDIYADYSFTPQFGYESRYDPATMAELFAERGGDPQRPGKRHPLDALVWRAHRPGEPRWEAPFGAGRPGWHIECSAIATNRLGASFAIQGGGVDLRFPHHEYSAAHAEAAHQVDRMASHYVHAGMIGLDGTKMSKSLGNLVFVSKLTAAGHEPAAIRLGVFSQHYRSDRDWSAAVLRDAEERLSRWRRALADSADMTAEEAKELVVRVATPLSQDLDTPGALEVLDDWARSARPGADGPGEGAEVVHAAVDALLGVRLRR